jgi:hypothetical protein
MMITNVKNVADNIADAVDTIGKKEVGGIQFETADPRLLDIRDGDFNDHVSMQPAAIAYYGMLKKTAVRNLECMKRAYERWQKKSYATAKQALAASGTPKPTVNDIEAFILLNNEAQIEKFEKDIEQLQDQADTLDVWYAAWGQKSYSIREHGELLSDERRTSPSLTTHASEFVDASRTPGANRAAFAAAKDAERIEEKESSFSRVKNIMRKAQERKGD